MRLISPAGHDCLTSQCLSFMVATTACVHACSGQCVFARVLSSADISSNVADISRGFEDLIPSVFEELCAALPTTLREIMQRSRQCAPAFRPLVYSI